MKLYYAKGACSLSQHILLECSGLKFEAEAVDLRTKVTASGKDFYQINPRGQVPTLILDDGTILPENIAIAQYIADRVPEKHLLAPINHIDRYQTLAWLSFVATDLHAGFGALFTSDDENVRANAFEKLARKLQLVDERLAGRAFIATEVFTVADSYLYVVASWRNGFDGFPDYPNLDRYCQEIGQMKAVQKAQAAEA